MKIRHDTYVYGHAYPYFLSLLQLVLVLMTIISSQIMSKKSDIYIRTILANHTLDDVTSLANSQISILHKISSQNGRGHSLYTNVLTNITIMPFRPSITIYSSYPILERVAKTFMSQLKVHIFAACVRKTTNFKLPN